MNLLMMLLPLINSIWCGLFGSFLGKEGVKLISFMIMFFVFINSWIIFYESNVNNYLNYYEMMNWFNLGLFSCSFTFKFDLITVDMIMLVSTVSLFVHIFSYDYMNNDPHFPSFMSYLSLFTFFMFLLISSSNLIQLFMGWEGVGLCSYLLMNFWYTSIQANKSSFKAMIMNKIGDIGFLLGMLLMWLHCGSFEINEMFLIFLNNKYSVEMFTSLLLLLIGVMGKSAQLGLHIWLPDAMEGPTPVSALIHAATMVTAGVLLIISMSPLFELSSSLLMIIMIMGSLTSFFSATMGMVQNDMKKVMAYSTCSQLGYMVMMCGFSFYDLGLFHLINHGFFKALLFLSAGSIIHSMYDEQDMSKYGGLSSMMPMIFMFMTMGSIALMGLPFLSGFYSKDLILETIYFSKYLFFSYWLSMSATFMTSFYSFSLMFLTFFKNPQENKFSFENIHQNNYKTMMSLSVLGILSIVSGYFLQLFILKDNFLLVVNTFNKTLMLAMTSLGLVYGMWLYQKTFFWWKLCLDDYIKYWYLFFMNNWYFDILINNFLFSKLLFIGYSMTYKLMDNQILEFMGPFYMLKNANLLSNKTSKIYINNIYSYVLISCIFFAFFIMIYYN